MTTQSTANFAVIFTARAANLDQQYSAMAKQLRTLAMEEFGCLEFTSASEGGLEIAISYWESEEQIQRWKKNSEHRIAQQLGRTKWYDSYSVEVVHIKRRYHRGPTQ